ncbi:MAG TPA: hypothetical protein VG389_29725, partial [Myxococcota bacterium]|nr:hypothetical protein [Myxococcota bacterium]
MGARGGERPLGLAVAQAEVAQGGERACAGLGADLNRRTGRADKRDPAAVAVGLWATRGASGARRSRA